MFEQSTNSKHQDNAENSEDGDTSKKADEIGKVRGQCDTTPSALDDDCGRIVQVLYIQMEFCERSTLRRCIDSGELADNPKQAWAYFRELIEGLGYIHEQVRTCYIYIVWFFRGTFP